MSNVFDSIDFNCQLERYGYKTTDTFQAKSNYIHRKITGTDVLISVGENIADFNGYIELNDSAAILWDCMKQACTIEKLICEIEEKFKVSKTDATNDVLDYLNLLQKHEMILINGV